MLAMALASSCSSSTQKPTLNTSSSLFLLATSSCPANLTANSSLPGSTGPTLPRQRPASRRTWGSGSRMESAAMRWWVRVMMTGSVLSLHTTSPCSAPMLASSSRDSVFNV